MASTEPDQDVTPALGAALAEPRAVCEHFYASHCYRGMSVRLCMLCHEPDWDDQEQQLSEARAAGEAKLGRVRALANEWIALAEAEDWADNPPAMAAGRAILAALETGG